MLLRHAFTCFVVIFALMGLALFVAWPGSPLLAIPILIASGSVLLAAFLPFPRQRWPLKDLMISVVNCALFSAGAVGIRYCPATRYNIAYNSIQVGMTLAEVENLVHRERDFRAIPIESSLRDGYVRLSLVDDSNNDDDYIGVIMFDGRVAEICPVPD